MDGDLEKRAIMSRKERRSVTDALHPCLGPSKMNCYILQISQLMFVFVKALVGK